LRDHPDWRQPWREGSIAGNDHGEGNGEMHATRRALLATIPVALAVPARAQASYPDRPIVVVAPFAAGGAADIAARTLAAHAPRVMARALGRAAETPMVVENRLGASGAVGTLHAQRARPDGHTLLLARVGSAAIVPALDPRAPYAWDEFTMLGLLDENPYVVCVRADAPWRTLGALIGAIREAPGRLNFATSGPQTILDLGMRHMMVSAGLPHDAALAIPFRGGGEALTALLAGQAQFVGNNLADMAGAISGGQVRALAVSGAARLASMPEVPTAAEAGAPALSEMAGWNALFGPPGLPEPVVAAWTRTLPAMAADAGWVEATRRLGSVPRVLGAEETRAFIGQQVALFRDLARRIGLASRRGSASQLDDDLAQLLEAADHALAALDPEQAGPAPGGHHLALLQHQPIGMQVVREAREGQQRVARRVAAAAFDLHGAATALPHAEVVQVQAAPARHLRADHQAGMRHVVGHRVQEADGGHVGIARRDQLDGGEAAGHRLGHLRLRPGRAARRQAVAEAEGDLRLDADPRARGQRPGGRGAPDAGGVEQRGRGRLAGRRRAFVAADPPAHPAQHGLLDRPDLRLVPRGGLAQPGDRRRPVADGKQHLGGAEGAVGLGHGARPVRFGSAMMDPPRAGQKPPAGSPAPAPHGRAGARRLHLPCLPG
jgi:tripartite-type tricarboxylate transporter receptor subunit TctC